jgi:predicted dehydrogenase
VEAGKSLIWARGAATTGRPYLARAAEEHSGPHMPWFWQGHLQGGGVLNDMMCHSALVVRHLLTEPGQPLSSVKPVRITGHIASLKWSRPKYAKQARKEMGEMVDYAKRPSEDFASVMIEFETADGHAVIGEATTSWSYVGAGLRLSAELLGPEYSMKWNSLDSGLQLFFSREVTGRAGEDLVEKQNAEQGVMPVVPEEYLAYGYTGEDRHFVRAFMGKEEPLLTFDDGVEVVRMLMAAYQSAESGRTVAYPPRGIESSCRRWPRGAGSRSGRRERGRRDRAHVPPRTACTSDANTSGSSARACTSRTPVAATTARTFSARTAPPARIVIQSPARRTCRASTAAPSSAVDACPDVSTRSTPSSSNASSAASGSGVRSKARWQPTRSGRARATRARIASTSSA